MIVLDASVLIAHWAVWDPHAGRAFTILERDEAFAIPALTLAEALVQPTRSGAEVEALARLDRLGITRLQAAPDEPLVIARLRVETGLKLPDCCVLAAALHNRADLATFDGRLAATARERGVTVLD